MSRIPRPLARQIDRLARGAHAFHRFAHHPLCAPYAGEVVRIGRRARVCRGCAMALAGAVAGGAAGTALPVAWGLAAVAAGAVTAIAVWSATSTSSPGWGEGPSPLARRPKLLTRFAPAALASAISALGLRSSSAAGASAALLAAGAAALALARYRRRGPDRSACGACPERALPSTCAGLRPIVRREAAFRRAAARLLLRA